MQDNIAPKGSVFPLVAEQPVFCGPKDKPWPAGKHKAIVDLATGKVFSIVSRDYRLIRHEDAIGFLEKAIQKTIADGIKTPDLGGTATTEEVGRAVLSHLASSKKAEGPDL